MDLIIDNFWGGLGDWLSISTLPEEFSKCGHAVYLNESAVFRNDEIRELFLLNPFIKGVKAGEPSIGDFPGKTPTYQDTTGNHIKNWEVSHRLPGQHEFPKIYYEPKSQQANNLVLVDTTAISADYDQCKLEEILPMAYDSFPQAQFMSVEFRTMMNSPERDKFHGGKHSSYKSGVFETLVIGSIFEYCDWIASAVGYVSLHSGGHSLATAVKNQFNTELRQLCVVDYPRYQRHAQSCLHLFPGVKYLVY